jgi:hypothetical protein
MIEFVFAGIPLILIMVSIVEMALTMWTYETLAFAVREGARYAATKGQGCSYSGNSCGVTVAGIAQKISASGMGLAPGILQCYAHFRSRQHNLQSVELVL